MLGLIVAYRRPPRAAPRTSGNSWSGVLLFFYAVAFSFAYRQLSAGTGALIMFGLVQLTMLLAAVIGGERPPVAEWLGLVLAVVGLVWLVLPGLSAPPALSAMFMGFAGVGWGLYSLRGRGSRDALGDTAGNFGRATPLAVATLATVIFSARVSAAGVLWAVLSGAVTSGLGYVLWYAALRGLTAVRAAIVQLSVPVLAGLGGVVLLGERIAWRLVVAAVLILGGIALAVLSGRRATT